MAITLGEILNWTILENANLITTSFSKSTLVENITIMEAPDIGKWIDGKNIVLTSLYSIADDKRKVAELVRSLHSGRICALFVKIHRFVDQVPPPVILACEKLGIAVLEIPGHIRYIDIMYPVIAAIFDSQVVQLSYYKQTFGALSGPALSNKGTKSIVEAFANIVTNPVVLYNDERKCLFATTDTFARQKKGVLLEEGVSQGLDYSFYQAVFEGEKAPIRQLFTPIRVFGQTKAYLSIVEQNHPLTELDFIALENAVTVLSFELVKDFAEEEVASRFKGQIVEDIKRQRNLDSLKDRLSSLGLSTKSKYNVLLIEMPTNPISRTPAIVKQQLVTHQEDKVYDLLLAAKKKQRLQGFESQQGNMIAVFLAEPNESPAVLEKMLDALCQEIVEKVKHAFSNFPLHIGYTTTFRDIVQTPELYKNAADALQISRLLYGENSFCNYNKLGVYKILCLARERKELADYIPPSLTALMDYEDTSGLPLIETLTAYFQHGGNVQQTAKALFVHYKTLHYRLQKMQTVAGIDLKNSNEAVELQMGLAILRMLGND